MDFIQASVEIYKKICILMVKSFIYKDYRRLLLGKYAAVKRDDIKEALTWRLNTREIQYSNIQMKYFFKVIEYCKEKNLNLVFITTPLHPLYVKKKIAEKNTLDNFISKNLSGYKYLDYSKFQFIDDTHFADLWHLNYKGSKLFSQAIKSYVDQL